MEKLIYEMKRHASPSIHCVRSCAAHCVSASKDLIYQFDFLCVMIHLYVCTHINDHIGAKILWRSTGRAPGEVMFEILYWELDFLHQQYSTLKLQHARTHPPPHTHI